MPSFRVLLVIVPFVVACGGSTPPPPPAAPTASETPADKCLAIAGATREKKADEPAKITAKHILVKYKGSKRAPDTITRSREEACLRALEARSKLEGGASFGDVVKEYSEEPGAATREGTLGSIGRGDVAAPFADAAFELAPGEVSHVVETDFGFHVIRRTE
ncbi:MAG: peptidyl-prolyl cis-trans isomerase [Labilithrix sp.]|nr:peptidyl-prolyl cis-trans isomerase [Labilithrix sp.]MCW5815770.1 peptidyl-prolyl cis-trans isomerase [Labilithrix sp.]